MPGHPGRLEMWSKEARWLASNKAKRSWRGVGDLSSGLFTGGSQLLPTAPAPPAALSRTVHLRHALRLEDHVAPGAVALAPIAVPGRVQLLRCGGDLRKVDQARAADVPVRDGGVRYACVNIYGVGDAVLTVQTTNDVSIHTAVVQ